MIPILHFDRPDDRRRVDELFDALKLHVRQLLPGGPYAAQTESVRRTIADVASRGDAAIVDSARQFDDPDFTAGMIRVTPLEMATATERVPAEQMSAVRRSIRQVQEYQTHVLPAAPPPLHRPGVELGLRFTPLKSAGLYFPGGKAAYPSSLIMLAVPAIVAGVKDVVVVTPPSKFGRSDLVLAACHELKLGHVYRAGGAAAVAALAVGTETIPAVDKIVGPGNLYVQLAKRESRFRRTRAPASTPAPDACPRHPLRPVSPPARLPALRDHLISTVACVPCCRRAAASLYWAEPRSTRRRTVFVD